MTRRNVELVLLLVAAPVVALLFAMIAINQGQSLDMTTLGVPAAIFVAFVIAHLAVRKFAANADPALLPLSFALSGIGIAFVTSLAPNLAVGQVMWLFVGVACMVLVLVFVRNLDKVANYKYTLMIVGFLLLLSPLVPGLGQEIYGSRIWLHIGNYSFQPGEIAKIVIVLFLAGYLAQNREMLSVFTWRVGPFRLPDIRTLLPLLLMWGIALVIVVFEKDLGSALVFFFVFLVMLYVATGKKFYLVIGLGLIAIGGIGAFIGDALFYPAPMFVSLVTHGLQAVVISLLANRKGGKHSVNALIGVVLGALIMVIGYTLGRAFIYSTPEYAILKLPFQFLQAGVGAVAAMIICFPAHLLRFWEKFTK